MGKRFAGKYCEVRFFDKFERENRAHARDVEAFNRAFPVELAELPPGKWPAWAAKDSDTPMLRAMQNRRFLVMVFDHGSALRLSIARTALDEDGRMDDAIPWDTLQQLKAEAGYGDRWAVEVFPPDAEVVNHSGMRNFRYLWLTDRPAFAWASSPDR